MQVMKLHKGDIFTIPPTQLAYCLMDNQIDMNKFKIVHVYSKRLVPRKWYKKLMFWKWIKMIDLVDIEFIGEK